MKKLYSKLCMPVLGVVLLVSGLHADAQVSGFVFRDINGDGVRQLTSPEEPGEAGVIVRAFNAANIQVASVTTSASGVYSISAVQAPAGMALRIEFAVATGDQPAKRMASNKTNIQFVIAGAAATNVDFAVSSRKSFSDNANPYVATNAYTNGNALATGNPNYAGEKDNLYVFPYDLSNDGGSSRRVKNQFLGSVFGMTWQRESRTLFTSAYLKRHASFGPGGIGAVYKTVIDKTGTPVATGQLLNVSAMGINVGTDPRTVALPDQTKDPSTDPGVFAEVGKRGIGGMDISMDGRDLYLINMYEKKLHRIRIGNPVKASYTAADVTGNWVIPDPAVSGTVWHPMAVKVYQGKVYVGGVAARETTTAHNISDTTGLRGVVYAFDPATSAFTEVLRFPLSYRRGFTNADYRYEYRNNYWSGWQNSGDVSIGGPLRSNLLGSLTGSNATGIYYPQPMLCNIEFDVDGSMVLGIRDRFGDQGGHNNYFETGNGAGETYRTLASGEVLRAGKNGSLWTMENNGTVTTNGVTTTSGRLADNNPALSGMFTTLTGTPWGGSYGPGGGYYYYNQNFTKTGTPASVSAGPSTYTSHYNKANGGIAIFPGFNEVLMTAIDPLNSAYANGLLKNYNSGANAGNMSGRMELFKATGSDAGFGKAAALGDVEILIDAEKMEIGNRIWSDGNANGIQDAVEPGIANVRVYLRSPGPDGVYYNGDDELWSVITDVNGSYYFDETIVNDARRPAAWIGVSATNSGILPGFPYRVEIDMSQTALSPFGMSGYAAGSNRAIDSDGLLYGNWVRVDVNPGGPAAANGQFSNDYNIDFGFSTILLGTKNLDFTAVLNNGKTDLSWKKTDETNIINYTVMHSTNNRDFTPIGHRAANGSSSYTLQHAQPVAGINYYKIRVEYADGKAEFSETRIITVSNKSTVSLFPNPAANTVNVTLYSNWQNQPVQVQLINAAGQQVMSKTIAKASQVENLDVSRQASGYYILRLSGADGRTENLKLMIKK